MKSHYWIMLFIFAAMPSSKAEDLTFKDIGGKPFYQRLVEAENWWRHSGDYNDKICREFRIYSKELMPLVAKCLSPEGCEVMIPGTYRATKEQLREIPAHRWR